jgi:hypothetical protein
MTITPTSSELKSGVVTGNVPSVGGICFFRLRLPAIASGGMIYTPDKVEQALANFFRESNISTLRELALRAVADEVGEKAASRRQSEGLEPAMIPERVMVCMSSAADAPRVIRAGARVASRLGARWYAVYVETRGRCRAGFGPWTATPCNATSRSLRAWARQLSASKPTAPPTA